MTNLPSRYIIAVAVALGALNYLWLAGGNATWVPDQYRGVVKAVALVLALAVFALGMAMTARASSRQWLGTTVAAGSMTAGLGFVLIVASSAVLARGQFFHDGIRLGDLRWDGPASRREPRRPMRAAPGIRTHAEVAALFDNGSSRSHLGTAVVG